MKQTVCVLIPVTGGSAEWINTATPRHSDEGTLRISWRLDLIHCVAPSANSTWDCGRMLSLTSHFQCVSVLFIRALRDREDERFILHRQLQECSLVGYFTVQTSR